MIVRNALCIPVKFLVQYVLVFTYTEGARINEIKNSTQTNKVQQIYLITLNVSMCSDQFVASVDD